jgi:hypothetical protein
MVRSPLQKWVETILRRLGDPSRTADNICV